MACWINPVESVMRSRWSKTIASRTNIRCLLLATCSGTLHRCIDVRGRHRRRSRALRYGGTTAVSLAETTRVKNSKYLWPTFGQNMGFA